MIEIQMWQCKSDKTVTKLNLDRKIIMGVCTDFMLLACIQAWNVFLLYSIRSIAGRLIQSDHHTVNLTLKHWLSCGQENYQYIVHVDRQTTSALYTWTGKPPRHCTRCQCPKLLHSATGLGKCPCLLQLRFPSSFISELLEYHSVLRRAALEELLLSLCLQHLSD